jgi:hypothetical protein
MSDDVVSKLEEALRKFWKDYGRANTIKGAHTEIVIEPKFFLNGKLNPEIGDLLISVYLSQTTINDVEKGKITLRDGALFINDKYGKPIAEVRNQSMIQEFTSRFGF